MDLVKAYDTADHKLLIKILEQCGAPSKFCSAVERMYMDLTVVLKLGKSIAEISLSVGVRQGDNMAPALFIFLVSAFAKSLEAIWEKTALEWVPLRDQQKQSLAGERDHQKSQAIGIHLIKTEKHNSITVPVRW